MAHSAENAIARVEEETATIHAALEVGNASWIPGPREPEDASRTNMRKLPSQEIQPKTGPWSGGKPRSTWAFSGKRCGRCRWQVGGIRFQTENTRHAGVRAIGARAVHAQSDQILTSGITIPVFSTVQSRTEPGRDRVPVPENRQLCELGLCHGRRCQGQGRQGPEDIHRHAGSDHIHRKPSVGQTDRRQASRNVNSARQRQCMKTFVNWYGLLGH